MVYKIKHANGAFFRVKMEEKNELNNKKYFQNNSLHRKQ